MKKEYSQMSDQVKSFESANTIQQEKIAKLEAQLNETNSKLTRELKANEMLASENMKLLENEKMNNSTITELGIFSYL